MSGMDDSDNTSITATDSLLRAVANLLPDCKANVEAAERRGEELKAEAEQLRARGEQLKSRIEARQNEDSGTEE